MILIKNILITIPFNICRWLCDDSKKAQVQISFSPPQWREWQRKINSQLLPSVRNRVKFQFICFVSSMSEVCKLMKDNIIYFAVVYKYIGNNHKNKKYTLTHSKGSILKKKLSNT
jgi:hypothetical protein